jgi:fermentation-respiration switch protein FrsA (DUF1100 family)
MVGSTQEKPDRLQLPLFISTETAGILVTVIPTDEARVLFAAANQPKKLLTFPGAGHNVFGSVGDPYLKLVEDFIKEAMRSTK